MSRSWVHEMQVREFADAVDCPISVAVLWRTPMMSAARKYDIDRPLRLAAWLAQIGHESNGLRSLEENLRYSAERLVKVWPNRFRMPEPGEEGIEVFPDRKRNARLFAMQPEKIANFVYAGRMGNGDEASGDGWKYRGRGPLQITGKANYAALARHIEVDVVKFPELLVEPYGGSISAGWYWHSRALNELADARDMVGITRAINGGTHGLEDRIKRYERAKRILGID